MGYRTGLAHDAEAQTAQIVSAVEQSELELKLGGIVALRHEQPGRDLRLGGSWHNATMLCFTPGDGDIEGDARGGLIGGGIGPNLEIALPGADRPDRRHQPRRSRPHAPEFVNDQSIGRAVGAEILIWYQPCFNFCEVARTMGSAPVRVVRKARSRWR
jgi:hypothetical protein